MYHACLDKHFPVHFCSNPQYEIEDYNFVTGECKVLMPFCVDLRKKNGACGNEGHGWIYRGIDMPEYTPLLFEVWQKIKKFCRMFVS